MRLHHIHLTRDEKMWKGRYVSEICSPLCILHQASFCHHSLQILLGLLLLTSSVPLKIFMSCYFVIWTENKEIPTELREGALPLSAASEWDESGGEHMTSHQDDEYRWAGVEDPKIVITTSRDPSSRLKMFAKVCPSINDSLRDVLFTLYTLWLTWILLMSLNDVFSHLNYAN